MPECLKLTMPQILMLNHAAWVNAERIKRKTSKNKPKSQEVAEASSGDEPMFNGKKVSELSSEEYLRYLSF